VPFVKYLTLTPAPVSAGGSAEVEWTSDGDYTIKRIYFVEKTGAPIRQVEVTIRLETTSFTDDFVPAIFFEPGMRHLIELDLKISRAQKIVFGIKNNEAASRSFYVVLELWS